MHCIGSMIQSVEELEAGVQFSFYDLVLSPDDTDRLAQIEISDFRNLVVYASDAQTLDDDLEAGLADSELNATSLLISRLAQGVMCASKRQQVEIVIRTELAVSIESSCYYWHIDKNYQEVLAGDASERPIQNALPLTFIMPLKGAGTLFYEADDEAKARLLRVANETKFFYGHTEKCSADDEINVHFDQQAIQRTSSGFGSVHKTGIGATIHASPMPDTARLLLLITPL